MYNIYPKQMRAIVAYIEALDAAEERIHKEIAEDALPYLDKIQITDADGTDYGELVDEIGGAWSWKFPNQVTPGV